MFDGLMRSIRLRQRQTILLSPLAGQVMPLSSVNDETFSAGLLGDGVAIQPSSNRVVAPEDAKVDAIFPTGHAVALRTFDGLDILIHIGIDTVKLQGRHFKVLVRPGDMVSQGDVLIEFDRAAIAAEGFDTIAPVLVRNALEFGSLKSAVGKHVEELDKLIVVRSR